MIGLHANGENLNVSVIAENLAHEDRRVRLLASRLVSKLEPKTQIVLENNLLREGTSRALVAFIVGATWEGSPVGRRADTLLSAVKALDLAANSSERADAVRSIQLCAGDWKTQDPSVELYSAYSLNWLVRPENSAYMRLVLPRFISKTLAAFPSKNDHENTEAGRLLAMLEVDHAEAIPKALGMITADSHPTQDFHYLIVLSRLKGARTAKHVQLIGDALLDLERKLDGRNLRVKQTWNARFGELAIELLKSNPGMEKLLGEHKDLVRPGHVVVAAVFKGEARILAARRFLNVVKVDVEFPMSAELIDLLAILPPADFAPVFRAHWADRSARDAMVKLLARQPDPADRTKFLDVVESGSADAARLSLNALALLKRDDNVKNLVPLFSRLRQAIAEPKEAELRKDLIAAINRQSGQSFRFNEVKTDAAVLAIAYQPLNDWFAKTHPAEAKALTTRGEDEEAVRKIMATVNWEAGNAERGSKVGIRRLVADHVEQRDHRAEFLAQSRRPRVARHK